MTRRLLLATALLLGAAGPVPPLLLDAPGGAGSLRVLNPGRAAVTVAGAISVESLYDGKWRPSGVYFYMVEHCEGGGSDPARVVLQPGIAFIVVPWTGWSCSGQCLRPCRANMPLAGTFRPVLTMLPSGQRVTGPVWEMRGVTPP